MALGELISNWHISDFHIQRARPEQEAGYAEHLSKEGENLSLVTEYLYQRHRKIFKMIITIDQVPSTEIICPIHPQLIKTLPIMVEPIKGRTKI